MQMLCRLLDRWALRSVGWGLAFCLASATAYGAPTGQPVAQTAAQVMQKAVVEWVAQTQSVPPQSVVLAPLDARMQVRSCDLPLELDLPFASTQTVRVRCARPVWQLYVRVTSPGPVANRAAVPGTTAEAPAPRQVLVAAVALQRGMRLNASHVRVDQLDAQGLPQHVLEQVDHILHTEVVRDVRPGTPLRSQDIRPTVLVKRGQMVLMSVGQPQGFRISARVEAMQDGRLGEQIRLKSPESGRVLTGRVKGPNQVEGL